MYKEYLDFVEGSFYQYFSRNGYINESAVGITSQIDDSVTFIGSATSPMKKHILNKTIGDKGMFILQNSLRNRGLKKQQLSEYSMYGSYFISMGAYVEYNQLSKLVLNTFDYLVNYIKIPTNDIGIRINSKDKDLISSIKDISPEIFREYDTFEEKYYRHNFGLVEKNIYGRNFNICVRKKNTDTFLDIGNVIIIENDSEKLAVELALGNCTISMSHFGVDSTVESSRMGDILEINSIGKMKFADSIIVCSILLYEDVKRIRTSRWPIYLFRKYCTSLDYWKNKYQIPDKKIVELIRKFLIAEYKANICLSDEEIIKYFRKSK